MLTEMMDKLATFAKNNGMVDAYYGACNEKLQEWNYIVFNRTRIKNNGKIKGDFNEYYAVNIVHEDAIPEEYIYKTIQEVLKIKGVKLTNEDITISYTRKGNTDVVVEIATIIFTKANYRGDIVGKGRD